MSKTTSVSSKQTKSPVASTKDTGKVRVGGSSIRFASVRDLGKVHVGGSSMRF